MIKQTFVITGSEDIFKMEFQKKK